MSVIIGAATNVSNFDGVVSLSWNMSPNVRRLWEIGSFDPYRSIINATQTINITCYGGGGPEISITRAESCVESTTTFTTTVSPAACGDSVTGPSGSFYLTSYSFNKSDAVGPGQTTYVGQQWVTTPTPNYVICGGAEGTAGGNTSHGVVFSTTDATGLQGSVSAGAPGIGQANEIEYGVVSSVGNSPASIDNGKTGTASVTVKHQPLWVE